MCHNYVLLLYRKYWIHYVDHTVKKLLDANWDCNVYMSPSILFHVILVH
jgi:hypothetical protein